MQNQEEASLGSRFCTFISSCAPGPLSPLQPNPHSATKAAIWKCKSDASSGRPKGLGKFSVTARQNSGVIAETSLINLPPEIISSHYQFRMGLYGVTAQSHNESPFVL